VLLRQWASRLFLIAVYVATLILLVAAARAQLAIVPTAASFGSLQHSTVVNVTVQ